MRVTRARPPEPHKAAPSSAGPKGATNPPMGAISPKQSQRGPVGPNSFMKKNLAGSARARGGPPGDSTRQRTLPGSFAWIRPGAPEKTVGIAEKIITNANHEAGKLPGDSSS